MCKLAVVLDLPPARQHDDALAQPTRALLFGLLGEIARPATTGELAERLGLHVNGVRAHLDRLAAEGLVRRERERGRRGRPRDAWTIAPDARPGGEPPRAYGALSRWLARAMREQGSGPVAAERAGRQIGGELAPDDPGGAREALPIVFSGLGFQPEVLPAEGDRLRLALRNCPYRDAVHEDAEVVCALHRGITQGVLARLDPGAALTAFVPHDPDRAGCRVEIAGVGGSV